MSANRAREIFIELVANVPPEQWEGRLAELGGEDTELRRKVAGLLAAHQKADSFLEQPAGPIGGTVDEVPDAGPPGETPPEPGGAEQPGLVLAGRYKLLEPIGEGGMGNVWMAQQTEPVKRLVAVKLVKAGMDSKAVLARFEAERQALALMDHPHIAKVLDAGAAPDGRPFFVMELVKGVPITRFCDEQKLTPRERLGLFVPVCQALQHAHTKGVIHRDIKPSNVLVALYDDRPVVKVIDFGVAKATGQQLTERTLHTGFGAVVGTLEYMSPEQASFNQLDVDTRSDVYALGVLLYELLAGSPPFTRKDLEKAGMLELLRVIREQEPSKPSTKLSTAEGLPTLAANRGTEPKRLMALVRGELDWIVMKTLEKDRNRRYETANGLALDVERYLRDEPVLAGPPSALYRFRKFARRNKGGMRAAAMVAVVVVLALAALAVSTVLTARANRDLHQALERERQNAYFQRIALADREWAANNLSRMQQLLEECPADLRGWEWHYLRRLPCKALPPLRHESNVYCAVFSPDSRRIASTDLKGHVKVWDVSTGKELLSFQAGEQGIQTVAFSPDGLHLATGHQDTTIKIWDAQTGQQRRTLPGHRGKVFSVAFSPDGRRLASVAWSPKEPGVIKVWNAHTAQELFSLDAKARYWSRAVFSPDGRRLACGSDRTVKVWDAETGRQLQTCHGHSQGVKQVAFSPDGKRLASAAGEGEIRADGELKVWDIDTGQEALNLRGHTMGSRAVAFSPDGRRLVSAGSDKIIRLWEANTGREILTLRGHQTLTTATVEFSPDGTRLVSTARDHVVRVWDATPLESVAGEEVLTLRGHRGAVRGVTVSPDGRCLATAGDDGVVKIWETQTGRELRTLQGYAGMLVSLAFSSRGKYLALAGNRLTVWDTNTWDPVLVRSLVILTAAFSPDERYLALNWPDNRVRIWEIASEKEFRTLRYAGWTNQGLAMNRGMAFSPNGRILAAASYDGSVPLWEVQTGEQIQAPHVHHATLVSCVAFSPDGAFLASGSHDQTVRIWDTATWRELRTLHDPTGSVESLAWHPTGRWLAWGGTDATVKIGDPSTGTILRTLRGHTNWVGRVAFSPDGRWLASASLDGTVKIWDVTSLAEQGRPTEAKSNK